MFQLGAHQDDCPAHGVILEGAHKLWDLHSLLRHVAWQATCLSVKPPSMIGRRPTSAPIILHQKTHIRSNQTLVIVFHHHQAYSFILISLTLVINLSHI